MFSTKPSSSAYSKMYLVSPGVYEKLLKCIDEEDVTATEAINVDPFTQEEKSPSEMALEQLHKDELYEKVHPDFGKIKESPMDFTQGIPITTRIEKRIRPDPNIPVGEAFGFDQPEPEQLQNVEVLQPQSDISGPLPQHIFQKLVDVPTGPILPPSQAVPAIKKPVFKRVTPVDPLRLVKHDHSYAQKAALNPLYKISKGKKCSTTPQGIICSTTKPQMDVPEEISSRQPAAVCSICSRTFTRRYGLVRHMRDVHRQFDFSMGDTASRPKHLPTYKEGYPRWIESDDEEMSEEMGQQGEKRDLEKAQIKTLNPTKVSRISKSFSTWKK